MPKIIFFLIVILLIGSCKDANLETLKVQESKWETVTDSLPVKLNVDVKAQAILNDWKDYMVLERSFDKIYSTENREDFVLIVEELVENQKKMEEGIYPERFDVAQIKSRQKIFKTYVLKTKGDLEYRQNPKRSLVEMITAFNELRNQFNVIVKNTLPDELRANEDN
ncbi:hypothetical protein [Maribacter hydrothermalis]|uniref:Uncharacterized protein n=1 Tax=Maribacter hydrothermalis TaxID=1836467 RepID=A0A1B7ZEV7_9FLAO|nr:hypothetical protein [Maribacter hydrothermalis]APQ17615.1 hypothetical protein BTR34_09860 [Maribacter hydrothermalis]OBR42090.1 hypothetical protein A9200_01490 [Maribacter hydrothermalis]